MVDGKEVWPIIPAQVFLSTLIAAGVYVRLDGKRQLSTAKGTMLPAFLSLEEPYFKLHKIGDPKAKATWEVDMQQGRNPNGGEAVCLVRPRFDEWAFTVHCQIDTKEIGEQTIRDLFDLAGRRVGLLDYRPARKGMFGQFKVNGWDRI